jgi:hypothetical protein
MSKSHHVLSLNSERPTQEAAATVAVNERALSDRLAVIHFWPCNPDRGLLLFLRAMVVVFVVSFLICETCCAFRISGGNWSHSSSIMSEWSRVDLCMCACNLKLRKRVHCRLAPETCCVFGISDGNWSHSSSITSEWLTVDLHTHLCDLKLRKSRHCMLARGHVQTMHSNCLRQHHSKQSVQIVRTSS